MGRLAYLFIALLLIPVAAVADRIDYTPGLEVGDLTASKLVSTDADKHLVSIAMEDLTGLDHASHSAISLVWSDSGHTGTATRIPYFGAGGVATESAGLNFDYADEALGIGMVPVVAYISSNGHIAAHKHDDTDYATTMSHFTAAGGEIWSYGPGGYTDMAVIGNNVLLRADTHDGSTQVKFIDDLGVVQAHVDSHGGAVFNEQNEDSDFNIKSVGDENAFYLEGSTGNLGLGFATPSAVLHLKAGTAAAGTGPLKFANGGALLASAEVGAMEYVGGKLYFTNILKRKVLDRTSDVAVSTVTVENTTDETTIWTGPMAANSLRAGNLFKFHADGVVENGGPAAADQITIRIKVGGVTKVTLTPAVKALAAGTMWMLDANATQRTIGAAGMRVIHVHLTIGDAGLGGTGDEVYLSAVAAIDTTANMDVTVTAQWASADVANILDLYQAFMEYKN